MVRLFAHRGFAKTKDQQNTIIALQNAIVENFEAIEFDIWFVQNKLVLKHDLPQESEINDLPILGQYLVYGNKLQYWLDFKNLDEENCFEVLQLVKKEIDLAQIDIKNIYFAPFITNYYKAEKIFKVIKKVFPQNPNLVAVCEELEIEKDENILQGFLLKNQIKYLSIFHELLTKSLIEKLKPTVFFAWTVNDLTRLKELQNLGVTNFATDNITPQIYDQKS